jgi:hypothetical protein
MRCGPTGSGADGGARWRPAPRYADLQITPPRERCSDAKSVQPKAIPNQLNLLGARATVRRLQSRRNGRNCLLLVRRTRSSSHPSNVVPDS